MKLTTTLLVACALFAAACQSTDAPAADNVFVDAATEMGGAAPAQATYSHDVYFTLEDASQIDGLIASCWTLREIPGVLHVTAGRRDESQVRDINDATFEVALHVEFDSAESYAGYGPHPVHQALVTEFGPGFAKVVVFDAEIVR